MQTIIAQRKPIRQGDVMLIPVDRVPDKELGKLVQEATAKAGGRVVMAYGEATGHAHAFYPDQDIREQCVEQPAHAAFYELQNPSKHGQFVTGLLRLSATSLLRHEEHGYVATPGGDWLKIDQHEGDEVEELRRVAD